MTALTTLTLWLTTCPDHTNCQSTNIDVGLINLYCKLYNIQNSENNNCERHEVNDQLSIAVLQPSSAKEINIKTHA